MPKFSIVPLSTPVVLGGIERFVLADLEQNADGIILEDTFRSAFGTLIEEDVPSAKPVLYKSEEPVTMAEAVDLLYKDSKTPIVIPHLIQLLKQSPDELGKPVPVQHPKRHRVLHKVRNRWMAFDIIDVEGYWQVWVWEPDPKEDLSDAIFITFEVVAEPAAIA